MELFLGLGRNGMRSEYSFSSLYRIGRGEGTRGGSRSEQTEKGLGLLQQCLPPRRLGSFITAKKSTSAMCSRPRPWAWKNSAVTQCCSSLKPMESSGKVGTRQCCLLTSGTSPALMCWLHLDAYFYPNHVPMEKVLHSVARFPG